MEPSATRLPARTDVLIVGAGFMGRWLAWYLSKVPHPPEVLVVERDGFTYGASSRNAGFLTCGQVSEMLADVEAVGLDAVVANFLRRLRGAAIVREAFPDLAMESGGSIDWDPLTDAKRDLADRLNAAAGEEVYRERTARLAKSERPAMSNLVDGALHPVDLLRRLRNAAAARFAFGVTATRVGGGSADLETSAGSRTEVRYDKAFICTNAFARDLGPETDVRAGRGQIVVTTPVETRTERVLGYLHDGYDYFRFIDDRLLLGGGRHAFPRESGPGRTRPTERGSKATGPKEGGPTKTGTKEGGPTKLEPTAEVRAYLRDVARRVIGHDDFCIEHHWAGIMGFPGGRHVGGSPRSTVDACTEVVAGFGGMGVALTPVVAEEIAGTLVRGS